MKNFNSKIEGWGLILILLGFGWQVFQGDLNDLASEQRDFQIHEKLDDTWILLGDIYTHSKSNNTTVLTTANYEVIDKNWKYWSSLKAERERVEFQSTVFLIIQFLLYVTGSILIIIPKFRKEKTSEN